jgi:hypothetical protein
LIKLILRIYIQNPCEQNSIRRLVHTVFNLTVIKFRVAQIYHSIQCALHNVLLACTADDLQLFTSPVLYWFKEKNAVLSEKTSTLYFQEDFHVLYTFIKLFTLKTGITKYKNIPGGFQKYNTWFEQFNNTQYCIGNMFWFLRRDLARRPLN